LASEKVGEAYRTGIAADPEAYTALWGRIGLTDEPPPVDFQTEVVVWLGAVYGSSCPEIRLDAVVSDVERRLVHGTIVLPSIYNACTADANPHAFLVAIDRSKLPAPPFGIQLDAEDPPAGAPEERTIVETDLREPGSTPGSGEVHFDPNLPEPYVVEPGSMIEPDVEVPFRLDVSARSVTTGGGRRSRRGATASCPSSGNRSSRTGRSSCRCGWRAARNRRSRRRPRVTRSSIGCRGRCPPRAREGLRLRRT
jgi:hypothetical protein